MLSQVITESVFIPFFPASPEKKFKAFSFINAAELGNISCNVNHQKQTELKSTQTQGKSGITADNTLSDMLEKKLHDIIEVQSNDDHNVFIHSNTYFTTTTRNIQTANENIIKCLNNSWCAYFFFWTISPSGVCNMLRVDGINVQNIPLIICSSQNHHSIVRYFLGCCSLKVSSNNTANICGLSLGLIKVQRLSILNICHSG